MQEPVARPRRLDDSAADMGSLVALGHEEPPPTPAPAEAAPTPSPADGQEAVTLSTALADAGIAPTPGDEAAVQALAALDPATVATVERWLRAKPSTPATGPSR